MITPKAILEYHQAFPKDICAYSMPSTLVFITPDGSDITYISTFEEDDSIFLERIRRSKECGRNLFYEEWKEEPNAKPGQWF